MVIRRVLSCFFFFNDTATTEIYTLSLHDALPISHLRGRRNPAGGHRRRRCAREAVVCERRGDRGRLRSEEHTSELQSQSNLVCRLLLEKKKNKQQPMIALFHGAPVVSQSWPLARS